MHLSLGERFSLKGDERFPLASVCKLPIAMNILALVDEGKLGLNQEIEVLPRDVWSGVIDIEKRWPAQRRFVLNEMIELMVAKATIPRLKHCSGLAARVRRWRHACTRTTSRVATTPT